MAAHCFLANAHHRRELGVRFLRVQRAQALDEAGALLWRQVAPRELSPGELSRPALAFRSGLVLFVQPSEAHGDVSLVHGIAAVSGDALTLVGIESKFAQT